MRFLIRVHIWLFQPSTGETLTSGKQANLASTGIGTYEEVGKVYRIVLTRYVWCRLT